MVSFCYFIGVYDYLPQQTSDLTVILVYLDGISLMAAFALGWSVNNKLPEFQKENALFWGSSTHQTS